MLPQGFLAANDMYCERYDEITRDFKNLTRCVDDALLWQTKIEEMFYKTCEYLHLCSSNGITFTDNKFKFCQ